jgi:uncharacterized protein involved in exopolysaccharide biosynthesis
VKALEATLKSLQPQLAGFAQKQTAYTTLTTELATAQQAVKLYAGALEKARIQMKQQGPAFSVVDPPALPEKPDAANPLPILLVTTLLGLLLSMPIARIKSKAKTVIIEEQPETTETTETSEHDD